MTAERWWVRFGARWAARIDSVRGYIGLMFQGMTGVSIASGALKYYGFAWLAPFLIIAVAALILVFAYYYSEGGVWNQVSRDRSDMSDNFAIPRDMIGTSLTSIGIYAALRGEHPDDEEVELITEAIRDQWEELRDGVDIE